MDHPKDTFVAMLAMLTAKMVEQDEKVQSLTMQIADRDDQIDDLRDRMDRKERDYSHSLKGWKEKYYEEHNRAMGLQTELNLALRTDPKVDEKAAAFMSEKGCNYTMDYMGDTVPDRIRCIKELRTITAWGLKEAKDYVEAWFNKREAKSA